MSNSEKLSGEELLERLETMLMFACALIDDKEIKKEMREAYPQIRTMIEQNEQNQDVSLEISGEQYMAIVMDLYDRIEELEADGGVKCARCHDTGYVLTNARCPFCYNQDSPTLRRNPRE